ncbi:MULTISPECIES: hypothetical protein [Clostridia]|uniref:hypothetical protein n=1 Tax=Clostridia TaxID=186801 RepID=UPI00155D96A3|nr:MULTISPECIES: hypothetical protein [Clostridia]
MRSILTLSKMWDVDASKPRKVNPSSLNLFKPRYTTKQEKDYAIQRIGVGLARRS